MKSSKTKVLNFDEHWNGCCISSNCEEDEARFHFDAGSQYKQDEIDRLKMSNHYLSVQVIDAEAYSEHWKYERDKLQKRIDLALEYIEPSDNINHKAYRDLYKILKGEPR